MEQVRTTEAKTPEKKKSKKVRKSTIEHWSMCALPILHIVVFCYLPLFGIIIAFKDYKYVDGILGSEWNGLDNFKVFFMGRSFKKIVANTVFMNLLQIFCGNLAAITLAILTYNLKSRIKVKIFQTALITPNFMSWVIAAYMVYAFLHPTNGFINQVLISVGMDPVNWYGDPGPWRVILIICDIWKEFGMGSIMYYAALMAIDQELFDACAIDGGGKWARVRYIMFPAMTAIIVIKLIFALGGIFGGDFGLYYQVPRNISTLYPVTDILPTYIFRLTRVDGNFATGAAAGLIQNIVGFFLVIATNFVVKKIDPEKALF